jgi:hypothetical protein
VKKLFLVALFAGLMSSCATYQYANNVKLIGFDDNPQKGISVGNVRGEDCTYMLLGYKLGGDPTVDKAFINAKNQASSLESAGFKNDASHANAIRYVNNVSTGHDGFDAGLFAKNCIVVTGVGYK